MSFTVRNLSVLAYAQGFTLWHYKLGTAPLGEAALPGYFEGAADMMAAGDMVMVSGTAGGQVLVVGHGQGTVIAAPMG
jgi:hypothetical protein